jgi:hypothetical protein
VTVKGRNSNSRFFEIYCNLQACRYVYKIRINFSTNVTPLLKSPQSKEMQKVALRSRARSATFFAPYPTDVFIEVSCCSNCGIRDLWADVSLAEHAASICTDKGV